MAEFVKVLSIKGYFGSRSTPKPSANIRLVNNATPVSASATLDATLLFVGGSDGAVHVLNAVAGGDTQQIPFPTDLCNNVSFTCTPDLIAVRP